MLNIKTQSKNDSTEQKSPVSFYIGYILKW